MPLSTLERKILNLIQKEIPLVSQPFKLLSKQLELKEEEFLQKIKRLKKKGIIHSFSAHLDHKKIGFKSTLLALKVPLSKLKSKLKRIVNYPEVTHCYLRQGEYNLWVVFIYSEKKKLVQFIKKITKEIGKENILDLPTKRQFKLKTRLKI